MGKMHSDRISFDLQYERILLEVSDLGVDIVVWIAGVWFRRQTYSLKQTRDLFYHAWEHCLRIRFHVPDQDDVVAYEAKFHDNGRFMWCQAGNVTPGHQIAKAHPAYQIVDDLARIRGNRSCVIRLGNGISASLLHFSGRLQLQVVQRGHLISSSGGMFNDEAYEFIGIAARVGGWIMLHVYSDAEIPEHRVYFATTSLESLGVEWRPEDEVFDAFTTHNELVREKFQIPEEDMNMLSSMFIPSYFYFDYPKDGACVRTIPNR